MEIQQVRYFLEVCEERNFTKAARKCGISQPSLTRAVKLLEKEFGGELFSREHGKIDLTELGRIVLPYLEKVWEQTSAVKRLTSDIGARNAAKLRLAVMCTIAPKLLIDMVSRFRTKHPDIHLELVDGTAQALEEQLLESTIDVAILARPNRNPNPRLNYVHLFREQMMIVLPVTHSLADRPALRAADLAAENYVMRALCEFAEQPENDPGRKPMWNMVYNSDRDDWVFAMIASGFGFGFAPKHSVDGFGLVSIPLIEPEIWRDIQLTTLLHRTQSHAVGALVHEAMQTDWLK
jgi:LysR family transcriptional regulator, hydrogen peroxide-inducible genes activator